MENANANVIEALKPESDLHTKVLSHLMKRLKVSENAMSSFHLRWQANELRTQAYLNLEETERQLREANDSGKPPKVVSVVFPYVFATISTVVTYLIHTFLGRRPIFQVGSYRGGDALGARNMEQALQFNADYITLARTLFRWLWDMQQYGVGILQTGWKVEKGMRTVFEESQGFLGFMGQMLGRQKIRRRVGVTVFEGNEVNCIDPFLFFPDPTVPMEEVAQKGEFVGWREFPLKQELRRMERDGIFKHTSNVGNMPQNDLSQSQRTVRAGGTNVGEDVNGDNKSRAQLDWISIKLDEAELGLGQDYRMWLFAVANRRQIVYAAPLEYDHAEHPVVAVEPYSTGYGFGHLGLADYLAPMQDAMSWFVNSHIDNVREVLNNVIVYDPQYINEDDLLDPEAGKRIRMKVTPFGSDIRSVISQLPVMDVTQSHVRDFELLLKLGDVFAGVNNNLRGMQEFGGRKTATEVRTSSEGATSRLRALAMNVSSAGMTKLARQMALNYQQFMSMDFKIDLLGEGDSEQLMQIGPESIMGNFHFPIHDGTLPIDRVAQFDVWKEILLGVAKDEMLRQNFSLVEIFKHTAELGGARNIDKFQIKTTTAGPDAIRQGQAAGNLVPIGAQ